MTPQSQDVILMGLEEANALLLKGTLQKLESGNMRDMFQLLGIATGIQLAISLISTGTYDKPTINAILAKLLPRP